MVVSTCMILLGLALSSTAAVAPNNPLPPAKAKVQEVQANVINLPDYHRATL